MALSAARAKAKNRLAWVYHRALHGYAEANGGRIPNAMRELQPYLMNTNIAGPARAVEIAMDKLGDDILERYRIVAPGHLEDLHPEDTVIVETGPVDNEFDTLLKLGHHWLSVSSIHDSTP